MASAHYFFRNYNISQVINLMCYMTEFPHTLTSTQKITRMYRYLLTHLVASFAEKESGPLMKTDATPTIIITIFELPEKNSRLF